MSSGVQNIRLRRPEPQTPTQKSARHTGILQDQLRRSVPLLVCLILSQIATFRAQRRPWNPSFSFAVRIILLMRVAAAMYSSLSDCDEGVSSLNAYPTLIERSCESV